MSKSAAIIRILFSTYSICHFGVEHEVYVRHGIIERSYKD